MPNVMTNGRPDLEHFFSRSKFEDPDVLRHHQILLFRVEYDDVEVMIIKDANDLLLYSDDTKCMAQWPGAKRSDWFKFTVGDYKNHLNVTVPQY